MSDTYDYRETELDNAQDGFSTDAQDINRLNKELGL